MPPMYRTEVKNPDGSITYVDTPVDNGITDVDPETTDGSVMSAEDEATINAILGADSPNSIFGGAPEPSKAQVEEMAKLRLEAQNYNVKAGAAVAEDALLCLAEQFNQSFEVLMRHFTLEWNNAIIRQDIEQQIDGCATPADDLQRLNPARFTEYGRNHIDQGIALLRESLRR